MCCGTVTSDGTRQHVGTAAAVQSGDVDDSPPVDIADAFRLRRRSTPDDGKVSKMCEECGRVFRRYDSFRSHKRLKHVTGQRPQGCGSCPERLPHGTQPSPPNRGSKIRKRLLCEVCGLRTHDRKVLVRHILTYHPTALGVTNSAAPHRCSSCEERFFELRALRHHVRLVHMPSRQRSKTSWFRRRRQRPRGGGPPTCRYCGRCFDTCLSVQSHELTHLGNKPYQCSVCSRGFRQPAHLATHRRTHTDERPFACSSCHKSYKNRVDLRKHSLSQHGIRLPVKRQKLRGTDGVDVVAAAAAAANISPDNADNDCTGLPLFHESALLSSNLTETLRDVDLGDLWALIP